MSIKEYSAKEELANVVSHALGIILGVVALITLLYNPIKENDVTRIVSFTIYGTSLILLFLCSTLYHSESNEQRKKFYKLLDHCAIYVLIAGSYTPLMLVILKGTLGYSMLALIWFIALAGIIFKIKFGHKYKKLSLATYLGMGFISLAIIKPLMENFSTQGLFLLACGGGIYTLGVLFYVQKQVNYTHAIWHLFVLAAATCHYFMMLHYV